MKGKGSKVRVGCWANLRRKLVDVILMKKQDDPSTSVESDRQYCDKLFDMEDNLKYLSPEERLCKDLEFGKNDF